LAPLQEEIQHGNRARWALHAWRRCLAANGKSTACEQVEEVIRIADDIVGGLKEMVPPH
jgi:hypothetical protein